ncbi:Zinc finger, DHHC-type containing [Seminavis robusta]|uniref:Zinc finger, DHHC-type containing n=1 Tax=Seminavis robusta TaxID=568900 RepID=A0A9N8H7V8_9STRA|nr:Zinc finger, DHHC-type containing [Seminavis robusta]|eukprot:Sro151_g069310.1 Zinc finger, DHHC-type containing (441) ;mRNA; f:95861-97447
MSAPMSMEEWQNRLRAQKKQDRASITKSAEILHTYRGGIKAEDEIQRKIRLEEQQKKKDAEENLRNFRPNKETIDALAPPDTGRRTSLTSPKYDGPLPECVQPPSKDDPRNSITAGAVSSIAANFTGSSTLTAPSAKQSSSRALGESWKAGDTYRGGESFRTFGDIKEGSVSAPDPSQQQQPPPADPASKTPTSTVSAGHSSHSRRSSHTNTTATNDFSAPTPSNEEFNAPTPMNNEFAPGNNGFSAPTPTADEFGAPSPTGKEFTSASPTAFNNVTAGTNNPADTGEVFDFSSSPNNAFATTTTDNAMALDNSVTSEDRRRADINFSFGLISTKAQPTLHAYMSAVQEVVQTALAGNREMGQLIICDPNVRPVVHEIQKDESYSDPGGRTHIQRVLVRAVVPVFLTKGITNKKARSFLIRALADALRKGYFLQVGERLQ